MIEEAVIVEAPARMVGDVEGTLVLTTERLVFRVGDRIAYQAARAEITGANQMLLQLYVFVRGVNAGQGFELRSVMAGPVPWSWHLTSPDGRHRRQQLGAAGDPRIGLVASDRRLLLDGWQRMMGSATVTPAEHYLDDVPEEPVRWADIVEIVYLAEGKGDGPPWLLVVRLADARWVYFQYQVDITGEIYSTTIVAESLDTLWWGAMTEDDRDRVTSQMTRERVDEELVRLDQILEIGTAHVQHHAERRMLAIRELRHAGNGPNTSTSTPDA